ncbi:MAG: 6-phosphofructokinase [Anaerolineae bacterium]|nr:6-phosphofructokinase [Anaerolineae bacterium]
MLHAPDARARLRAQLAAHGVDNLLLFGGDGSLRHLPPILREVGVPYVGIPTTIDNNVPGTEQTLGFDSACNFAYQALDGILATAHALPGRSFMVETLGGDTGFLALQIALGAGAHAVLIPEYAFDQAWLNRRLADAVAREGYALLVLSEGVPESRTLAQTIAEQTQISGARYAAGPRPTGREAVPPGPGPGRADGRLRARCPARWDGWRDHPGAQP